MDVADRGGRRIPGELWLIHVRAPGTQPWLNPWKAQESSNLEQEEALSIIESKHRVLGEETET